jgi:hypothetical protein
MASADLIVEVFFPQRTAIGLKFLKPSIPFRLDLDYQVLFPNEAAFLANVIYATAPTARKVAVL